MIFYFSGTGNSEFAAKYLAEKTNDKLVKISDKLNNDERSFTLSDGEKIGFVFPVYAWLPPKIVSEFLKKVSFVNLKKENYAYCIMTCGSDVGKALDVTSKAAAKKGITLSGMASIVMPDNYVVMFDIDTPEDIANRIVNARIQLEKISEKISKFEKFEDVKYQSFSAFKTYAVGPFFNAFLTNPRHFYAEKTCTKCGLCEKICPTKNIIVKDAPIWGKNCTACLACLHRCPVRAIQYGKGTKNKGRYYFEKDCDTKK